MNEIQMTIEFNYEPPFVKSELEDRRLFGEFLNQRGLLGEAVEIGTRRGDFAVSLLETWKGRILHCIDPFLIDHDNKSEYESRYHPAYYGENKEDKEEAERRFSLFAGRVGIHVTISQMAVCKFTNYSLGFVYIDGNHREPFVTQDVNLWWPKLGPNGILAGHDIHHPFDEDFPWSQYVRPAVIEFANKHNLQVHIVEQIDPGEDNSFFGSAWSWYIIKPD